MIPPKKFRVVSLKYESRICPMVLVGRTTDGSSIYVRVRFGRISIRIDPREDPPFGGAEGKWVYEAEVGDGAYTAWIDYDDLRALTKDRIEWPENEPE